MPLVDSFVPTMTFFAVLFAGCAQEAPEGAVKYVCADGTTTVTDPKLCPSTVGTQVQVRELTIDEALSVCYGMPSTQNYSLEDICIVGVAAKYKNTAVCKKLGKDQRTACYAAVAEAKADPNTCLEADTYADQCFEQYARDKKDGAICDKITDVSYRDNCYRNLAGQLSDATLCEKIKNVSNKDSCYFDMAMRLSDTTYCNKITSESQKQNCQQNLQSRGGEIMKPIPMS
jgi:hypothetical protein